MLYFDNWNCWQCFPIPSQGVHPNEVQMTWKLGVHISKCKWRSNDLKNKWINLIQGGTRSILFFLPARYQTCTIPMAAIPKPKHTDLDTGTNAKSDTVTDTKAFTEARTTTHTELTSRFYPKMASFLTCDIWPWPSGDKGKSFLAEVKISKCPPLSEVQNFRRPPPAGGETF